MSWNDYEKFSLGVSASAGSSDEMYSYPVLVYQLIEKQTEGQKGKVPVHCPQEPRANGLVCSFLIIISIDEKS